MPVFVFEAKCEQASMACEKGLTYITCFICIHLGIMNSRLVKFYVFLYLKFCSLMLQLLSQLIELGWSIDGLGLKIIWHFASPLVNHASDCWSIPSFNLTYYTDLGTLIVFQSPWSIGCCGVCSVSTTSRTDHIRQTILDPLTSMRASSMHPANNNKILDWQWKKYFRVVSVEVHQKLLEVDRRVFHFGFCIQ